MAWKSQGPFSGFVCSALRKTSARFLRDFKDLALELTVIPGNTVS